MSYIEKEIGDVINKFVKTNNIEKPVIKIETVLRYTQIQFSFYTNTNRYGFYIKDMPTGCGLLMMHGIGKIDEFLVELLEEIFAIYARHGAGTCIATMGDDNIRFGYDLTKWNFVEITRYPNYNHGKDGSYMQRLYQHSSVLK